MNRQIATIYTVVLISFVGLSMSQPLVTTYILSFPKDPYLYIKLSLCLSAHPLAQVFFLPLIGHVSDKIGRKKVLLFSTSANIVLYILMYFTVRNNNIVLLILLRVMSGMVDANVAVARAAISDLEQDGNHIRRYGHLNAAMQLGYVAGPLLFALLLQQAHFFKFRIENGFLLISIFNIVNLMIICKFFSQSSMSHAMPIFRNFLKEIYVSFSAHDSRKILLISLLSVMAVDLFYHIFPIILVTFKGISFSLMSLFVSIIALSSLVTNVFFAHKIHQRYKKNTIIRSAQLVFLASLLLFIILDNILLLQVVTLLCGISIALISGSAALYINDIKSKSIGKNMGIYISLRLLNGALLGLISSIFISLSISPLFLAIAFVAFASIRS